MGTWMPRARARRTTSDAVHARHHDVEDGGVEGALGQRRQRAGAVEDRLHAVAAVLEYGDQRVGKGLFVFDEQQLHGVSLGHRSVSRPFRHL